MKAQPPKDGVKRRYHSVNLTEDAEDRFMPSREIALRVWHHPPKRLEFRVDPLDRVSLSTRIDDLIDAIADIHRIKPDYFRVKTIRDADLVLAQQIAWYMLRCRWHLPHHVITSYFEHHRSTIIHGIQQVEELADIDDHFRRYLDMLPLWCNLDLEGGRLQAITTIFDPEGTYEPHEDTKTPPRARERAKKGIVGKGRE